MDRFTRQKLDFPNIWSRVLLKNSWMRQFHIPIPNPKLAVWLFKFIENYILKPDISNVKIDRPIFLIGPPRSGTTMLADQIALHENIGYIMNIQNGFDESVYAAAWIREKLNLNVGGERYLQDSIYADTTTSAEPSVLWSKWMGVTEKDLEWEEHRAKNLSQETIDDIYSTLKKVLLWWRADEKPIRFFCKYPLFTTEVRILRDLFPDAKFINIIRDGRAVANSLIKLYTLTDEQLKLSNHPTVEELIPYPRVKNLPKYIKEFGPASIETTARIWADSLTQIEEYKTEKDDIYDIRYEDILANPELELQKIWNFCEMEVPDKTNKTYWEKFHKIGKISHTNKYGQFERIEEIIGNKLRQYGYLD